MRLSNDEIMQKGFRCLIDNLGAVEAERFIFNLKKPTFNYTEWQREFFENHYNLERFLEEAQKVDESNLKNNPNCKFI